MPKHYTRWQENNIKRALKFRRILLLNGARQCGKTTLAKELSVAETLYYTLDDVTLLDAALSDPHGFVHHGNELMIIDEIQRAPILLQSIKKEVDENQRVGRFLLTGSANIQSLPSVKESLAGRIHKIHLRPLALGEIHQAEPRFIKDAFLGKFATFLHPDSAKKKFYDKDAYLSQAIAGGYPEALLQNSERARQQWYRDYLEALLDQDLRDIAKIKRKDSLAKLIEVLAAWSSKFMDISSIGQSLSLSRGTIDSYINALESLYLVERIRPWYKTDYSRVTKKDKLFMTDTGLMSAILHWSFEKVRLNGELNGKLMETFVFTQLAAILDVQEESYQLYHYRDREKREIDFIIENEEGDVLAIEVKSGSAVSKATFNHIRWFRDNLAGDRIVKGIVLYTGENVVSFGENMWAVPISSLWA